jgi:hypothetical protein
MNLVARLADHGIRLPSYAEGNRKILCRNALISAAIHASRA